MTIETRLKPGDEVEVPYIGGKARVMSVLITLGNTIEYKLRYYANGEEKTVWFYEDEFLPHDFTV